jgi:hypothetical protein
MSEEEVESDDVDEDEGVEDSQSDPKLSLDVVLTLKIPLNNGILCETLLVSDDGRDLCLLRDGGGPRIKLHHFQERICMIKLHTFIHLPFIIHDVQLNLYQVTISEHAQRTLVQELKVVKQ